MHDDQPSTGLAEGPKTGTAVVMTLLAAHAATLTPFLRIGFGREYPGIPGLLAIPLLVLGAAELHDPAMLTFSTIWFAMLILQRNWSAVREWTGQPYHAGSSGDPLLASLIPLCREPETAFMVEPLLCLGIGLLLFPHAPGLALWWAAGFPTLVLLRVVLKLLDWRETRFLRNLGVERSTAERKFRRFQKGS